MSLFLCFKILKNKIYKRNINFYKNKLSKILKYHTKNDSFLFKKFI